jgi:hypothetical protein
MNPSLIWDDPLSLGYTIIWEMHRDIVTKESPKVPLISDEMQKEMYLFSYISPMFYM